MAENLDHAYDEYLKAKPAEAMQSIAAFQKKIAASDLKYGKNSIPTFFKPIFLAPRQTHLVKRVTSTMQQIVNTAIRIYFEDNRFARYFRLTPEIENLVKIDPGYSSAVVFARFDGILEGGRLKFAEFNCDSPVGAAYSTLLSDQLLSDPLFKAFADEHAVEPFRPADDILNALLSVYEEFGGFETPTIAIMDWKNVRTRPEFVLLQKRFEERGYRTLIVDPRELTFKGGKLYSKETRVHLIYRRALVEELAIQNDEIQDFLTAYRERAVCVVNPLRSAIGSHKGMLSILTHPYFDSFFTQSENQIKHEHLPWTRQVADAEDFFGHQKMYLVDFLKDEKDSLVVKPSRKEPHREIRVGADTFDDIWNETISWAMNENAVMQEFVSVPTTTVPKVSDGKIDWDYKKYNFSALAVAGKMCGAFSRLSDTNVIRVADQGGLIPAFWSDQASDTFQ